MRLEIEWHLSTNPGLMDEEEFRMHEMGILIKKPTGLCTVKLTNDLGKEFIYSYLPSDIIRDKVLKEHGIDIYKLEYKNGRLCRKSESLKD